MDSSFNYQQAFSRNIGWVNVKEQSVLNHSKVAIAGLGGVGSKHLLTLSRLGIGKFNISDFDVFEIQNFNRQTGATMSTLQKPKIDILAKMALDINPELSIKLFPSGINQENVSDFLDGIDIYVDGLDFFAIEARRMLFSECYKRGIPAVTAAPLGMGVGFLYFKPGGTSFEQYFRLEGHSKQEQLARFIAGLSPKVLQRNYLVVPDAVDFNQERGPSTVMACDLCAGIIGTEVLKILLKRGKVRAVPWGIQFDAYRQKLVYTWRPFGNANPIQKLLLYLIRPQLKRNLGQPS